MFCGLRGCDENSPSRPLAGKNSPADCFSERGLRVHPLPPEKRPASLTGLLLYDLSGQGGAHNHPLLPEQEGDDMADTDKKQPVKQFEGLPLENLIGGPLAAAKGASGEEGKEWPQARNELLSEKKNDLNE